MKRWALRLGASLAVVYLLLLVDWRGTGPLPPPVLRRHAASLGPLEAGAARIPLALPLPVVMGGYGLRRVDADRVRDPLAVRALVLRGGPAEVGLVLLDVVLVPDELVPALEARVADLGLEGLLVSATHTHSSAGGFDRRLLAQVVGMGRYRADVEAEILAAAERALRAAHGQLRRARARAGSERLRGWARNRSTPGAPVDDELTVVVLEDEGGSRAALLAVAAAHPTVLARRGTELSAEYPGAAMRRLEEAGGTAFVLQGAAGDAALPAKGAPAMESAGALLARRVTEAAGRAAPAAGGFAFAEATVPLPPTEVAALRSPWWRRPASNLAGVLLSRATRVAALQVGGSTLLAVPGEPTAEAGRRLEMLATGPAWPGDARIVSLTQGYLGYVDTPEAVRAGRGEARRTWFGPGLLDRLGQGLRVAAGALSPGPRSSPPP